MENLVKTIYQYPYSIYKKYFPQGNIEEFDKAFITFDISEKDFRELLEINEESTQDYIKRTKRWVCWETVMFDLSQIKTPLVKEYGTIENNNIINQFRKI